MVRKLERPAAPGCLSKYRHGRDNWGPLAPGSDCRKQIWQQLESMQGKFCAYCERRIRHKHDDSHIEHFFQRKAIPQKTFSWDNLFGACKHTNTCGEYKDNKAKSIDPGQICKPDEMDPADYLQFLPNGSVQAKPGLTQDKALIAENTIKAFNLMDSALTGRRRNAAEGERYYAAQLYELLGVLPDDPDCLQDLRDNLARITAEEFSAVRKAVWLP